MKRPIPLGGAFARAAERLAEERRDLEAAIAAKRDEAFQASRQLGAKVGRAALDVARSQIMSPGLERQLMRAIVQAAPKLAVRQPPPSTPRPRVAPPRPVARSAAVRPMPEPLMHADAFVRGVADILTFSKADEMGAGIEALSETALRSVVPGWDDRRSLGQRYEKRLARQEQRDQFDETHRTGARRAGQAAGVVGGFATGSGLGSGGSALVRMLPNGARVVKNAQPVARLGLDMRGVSTLAAAGGGAIGLIDQLLADLARGAASAPGTYAASTAAGIAGGLAGRYGGPMAAGVVTGGLTPTLSSAASGGALSPLDIVEDAVRGGAGAGVTSRAFGAFGKYGSSALSSKRKGDLGEAASLVKSVARDGRRPRVQVEVKVGRRHTVADQVLDGGASLLEAKFGRWASLSQAQRAARRQFGPNYLIDHYLPKDVGRVLGVGSAVSAGQVASDE